MNTRVHFQDYSTYMECTYDNVCMKIYYDDKSIVDVVMTISSLDQNDKSIVDVVIDEP